jgi:hypothetical protein
MDVAGLRGSFAWMLGGREDMLGTLGGRDDILCMSDCELGLAVLTAARMAAAAAAAPAF